MHQYRIRIGNFESELSHDEFVEKLKDSLATLGTVSEVKDRGLTVTKVTIQGRPGVISHDLLKIIIEKPGLSERKIGNRLPHLSYDQVKGALRRAVKNGNIEGTPVRSGRYTHWEYRATAEGLAWFKSNEEAERDSVTNAKRVFSCFKELGYKPGSVIHREELKSLTKLSGVELRFALKALREKGLIEGSKVDGVYQERIVHAK